MTYYSQQEENLFAMYFQSRYSSVDQSAAHKLENMCYEMQLFLPMTSGPL